MAERDLTAPGWDSLRAVLDAHIQSLKDRMQSSERRIADIERGMDGHVSDLWQSLRKGQDKLSHDLTEHAKSDADAMMEVRDKLLARVPAWALFAMTAGASVIGAMASYIIDHVK